MKNWTTKLPEKGKSQEAESWKLPLFSYFLYVVAMQLKGWGDLLTKWTPPPSGAQSASR